MLSWLYFNRELLKVYLFLSCFFPHIFSLFLLPFFHPIFCSLLLFSFCYAWLLSVYLVFFVFFFSILLSLRSFRGLFLYFVVSLYLSILFFLHFLPCLLLWRLSCGTRVRGCRGGLGSFARTHHTLPVVRLSRHTLSKRRGLSSRPTGPLTARLLMDGGSALPRVSNRAPGNGGGGAVSSSTPSLSSTS